MRFRVSVLSTEYVPVSVTPLGPDEQDPSTGSVFMAVVAEDVTPTDDDWQEAEWDTSTWPPTALLMVGPTTAVPLVEGHYEVWVKFMVGSETPVLSAGSLEVY